MRRNLVAPLAVLALTLLGGCVTQPTARVVKINSQFKVEEALFALEKGSGQIKGSALLRQQGGGVVTCAGMEVSLTPVTQYSAERIQALYGSTSGGFRPVTSAQVTFDPDHQLYWSSMRKTRCDAQGFFKFENLKDGDFYVVTQISWVVPRTQYSSDAHGGGIVQKVSIRLGESKEVVLTSH